MAMPINKKAQNWRAARASGVKPGTRTMQDDGSLGGGTKLAGGPVKSKPRLPPLPPSPVSPNPDSPASGGASSGGREIASGGRNAGGPGSLPPIRPAGGRGRPGGPVNDVIGQNPDGSFPGKGPAVIPRPRNPGADSPLGPQASIGDQGYNPMLPPNHPLQGRGNALPMPVANLPGISNPGGPRLRNAGGVGSLPPQSGGADNPVSSDGGAYGSPQWGPGAEAGKADMIDQMQRYPGSGGIYAGGPGSLPPQQGGGGGSMGYEGEGGNLNPNNTGPDMSYNGPSQYAGQGGPPMGGDGQDPRMQGFLDKINLPARFGGDPQAAMKFLQQNPQSHFGQRFAGYNQNQARRGQQGILQAQPMPMQYNPLLNMG